jgi:Tol biopolymer transport system component
MRPKHWQSAMVVVLAVILAASLLGCGGGSSAPPPVLNPVPSVTAISPDSAAAGELAFTLNVNGSNFLSASVVEWNGSSRMTTFVSSTQLTAQIMAADLGAPGKVTVTVLNPAPGGGTSNAVNFTIAADTISFQSSRALDGSDATNAPNTTLNIWAMNSDGSGAMPLTKITALFGDSPGPAPLSPDGSKVVFGSERALDGSDAANTNLAFNIWVANADGSGATPLTKFTFAGDPCCLQPVWSPDASKIVFTSPQALDGSNAGNTNGTTNIWVINGDGSNLTPLTKLTAAGAGSFQPAWSPDGSKIVFGSLRALVGSNAANTNNTENIWVMNTDGSNATALTKLTAASANSFRPTWSPDGSKIAFTSTRALDGSDATNAPNSTWNIWVMKADGSSQEPLTKITAATADSVGPAPWSPDGTKVLFSSERALDGSDAADLVNSNITSNIWVVNPDGSGATPLTKLTGFAGASSFSPIWSPGGSKIVFASGRALDGSNAATSNGTRNIWVMNADGSGAIPLTKLTAAGTSSDFPQQP